MRKSISNNAVFAYGIFLFICLALSESLNAVSQTSLNLENGFKPYGSYDHTSIDTVNLLNGGLTVHIALPYTWPQRGGKLTVGHSFVWNSKYWQVDETSVGNLYWSLTIPKTLYSPFTHPHRLIVNRSVISYTGYSPAVFSSIEDLITEDGASHQLIAVNSDNSIITSPETVPVTFVTEDTSGYRVDLTGTPDEYGVYPTVKITDRSGNIYHGVFGISGSVGTSGCTHTLTNGISYGDIAPFQDLDEVTWDCHESSGATIVEDSNGNTVNFGLLDSLGRDVWGSSTTNDGCDQTSYTSSSNTPETITICYITTSLQSSFNVSGISEHTSGSLGLDSISQVSSITLADGRSWTFSYDSYGNITNIHTPQGAYVLYEWATVPFPACNSITPVSRSISKRTIFDGTNIYIWNYQWGEVASDGTITNTVTDPTGNSQTHTFTPMDVNGDACGHMETSTAYYQGNTSGSLLRKVDTVYSSGGRNLVPVSITTTQGNDLARAKRIP